MASTPAHVNASEQDGILVLTVVDKQLTNDVQVGEWKNQMVGAIEKASPKGVVIDMQNVDYITSVALFPLIKTRTTAQELGARCVLCNLSPTVAKVLTVTQLIIESRESANHFSMAESLSDALAMFAD